MLLTSTPINDEYFELARKDGILRLLQRRGVAIAEFADMILEIYGHSEHVTPTGRPPPCRDEDDRKYLHCAVAGRALWLVTRDRDLLDLGMIGDARIVEPLGFIAALEDRSVALDA